MKSIRELSVLFCNFSVSLKKLFQNRKVYLFILKEGLGHLRREGTEDLYLNCPVPLVEGFRGGWWWPSISGLLGGQSDLPFWNSGKRLQAAALDGEQSWWPTERHRWGPGSITHRRSLREAARNISGALRLDPISSFPAGRAFPIHFHVTQITIQHWPLPLLEGTWWSIPLPSDRFFVTFGMSTSVGREWSLLGILEQNSI